MVRELLSSRRKRLLGVLVVCIVLVSGLAVWLNTGRVAEAAVLDPHPGLVGWWRFDEGTGSVAKDSSQYGNDGTVYGATWVDGKYGKALSFDGVDDYVEIPSSGVLVPSEITIEFWVNEANPFAAKYEGFVCRNSRTNGLQVIKNWGNGRIWLEGWDGSTEYAMISNYVLQAGVWTHIVVTAGNDGVWKIYVNGQLDKQSTGNVLPRVAMPLWVGRAAQGTTNPYLKGTIDEVRIYNRALSAVEVQESFQKRPDLSSKLLAKIPKGTTQVITTLSWQGLGSINVTMVSPSKNYTEDIMPVYQKTVYSTSGGTSNTLNIKRLSVSVSAISSDENWYVVLKFDDVDAYQITVEVQK